MAIQTFLSEILQEHLPSLRRLMRAIAGDQTTGDEAVADLLETLIEEPNALDKTLEPRCRAHQVHAHGLERAPSPILQRTWARPNVIWSPLRPIPRQAFLLVSLEKFSHEEAAEILSISVDRVRALIERAGSEIAAQLASNVLIIEDESLIAMELKLIMTSLGHKVRGVARTHAQALDQAKKIRPDLVLADIMLADGSSGIDAVHDILRWLSVPVVFITSYPGRLLTGLRPEPTYLVTKHSSAPSWKRW